MEHKTIFERLNNLRCNRSDSEKESVPEEPDAGREYLDYIEGRTGKLDSGPNGAAPKPGITAHGALDPSEPSTE